MQRSTPHALPEKLHALTETAQLHASLAPFPPSRLISSDQIESQPAGLGFFAGDSLWLLPSLIDLVGDCRALGNCFDVAIAGTVLISPPPLAANRVKSAVEDADPRSVRSGDDKALKPSQDVDDFGGEAFWSRPPNMALAGEALSCGCVCYKRRTRRISWGSLFDDQRRRGRKGRLMGPRVGRF